MASCTLSLSHSGCNLFVLIALIISYRFRYLSDHGYNVATDSGSVVDTQKIVKRLLDVRIDMVFCKQTTGLRIYLEGASERESKYIVYSLT